MNPSETGYRGRLAPSPTGFLHLGHARTFWIAQERCHDRSGILILRNDDLDQARCRPEFVAAMLEDLRWFGLAWTEGPDCGGPVGPYQQSLRYSVYRAALEKLIAGGWVYPCTCSRKDILAASRAPHAADDEEPIYPGTCRSRLARNVAQASSPAGSGGVSPPVPGRISALPPKAASLPRNQPEENGIFPLSAIRNGGEGQGEVAFLNSTNRGQCQDTPPVPPAPRFSWRFQVPDGETISFLDANLGPQQFVAGRDFGDFVVWRHDDVPAYQLACAVDDAAMHITEVVRGADLLMSTARQLLLDRALGLRPPAFYHCELLLDAAGQRLAKRHDALSLRRLREHGETPELIRRNQFIRARKK